MNKAGVFILIGAGVGVAIGGVPLVAVGACSWLAGYGAYKACDSWFKEDSEESD